MGGRRGRVTENILDLATLNEKETYKEKNVTKYELSVTSCVNVRVPLASPTRTQTAFRDMLLRLAETTGDESDWRREENDPCNERVELVEMLE